jgi:pimeloyl-ACP methyl ester carboxylesterase
MRRIALLIARKLGTATLLDYSYADPARIAPERRALAGSHAQVAGWDLAWAALLTRSLWTPVEVAEHLAEVHQPTLVVTGETDRLVPPGDSRRVAEALPDAAFRVIPGCGHLPQEECPAAFAEVIGPWLDATFPAARPEVSER